MQSKNQSNNIFIIICNSKCAAASVQLEFKLVNPFPLIHTRSNTLSSSSQTSLAFLQKKHIHTYMYKHRVIDVSTFKPIYKQPIILFLPFFSVYSRRNKTNGFAGNDELERDPWRTGSISTRVPVRTIQFTDPWLDPRTG